MKINKVVLQFSGWIALFAVLLLPAKIILTNGAPRSTYGFPFRFFTLYHNNRLSNSKWFLENVTIDVFLLLINILVIYIFVATILYLKNKGIGSV